MRSDRRTRTGAMAALGCLLMLGAAGCREPGSPAGPPQGGREFRLDYGSFKGEVRPVLEASGCYRAGPCHGGGIRGSYELSPPDEPDTLFDFEQTALQVNPNRPLESPILAKPLAAGVGGSPHSWEPFESMDDSGYAAILDWIESGEFAP